MASTSSFANLKPNVFSTSWTSSTSSISPRRPIQFLLLLIADSWLVATLYLVSLCRGDKGICYNFNDLPQRDLRLRRDTGKTGLIMVNMTTPAGDFGVYIHWPFCLSKCPYCDFNSHVRHAAIDEARYVRAFAAEIASTAARIPRRTVSTIF